MIRRTVFALAAVALAACSQPEAVVEETAVPPEPLPALAAWVTPLVGQPAEGAFTTEVRSCVGWADGVNKTYVGGIAIGGWIWNQATKAPYAKVIVVDEAGLVQGGGDVGLERGDVPEVRKDVTSAAVGYEALSTISSGVAKVYGIDEAAKTRCYAGQIAI